MVKRKKERMMCLLGPQSPFSLINTQYGQIKWSEYLRKEALRIGNQKDRIVEIKKNCLYVNIVAE